MVVGANRAHASRLGCRNRWPRRLGGALASPALFRWETMLGEPLCLLAQFPLAARGDPLHLLSQLSIMVPPRVAPSTLFGSFKKSAVCEIRCHAAATRISRPSALRGLGAGPFHSPLSRQCLLRWRAAHPSTGDPSGPSKEGYRRVRGPSAVQADSVASGSPARLRACRACSWRPRWPRSYQYASRLYQIARFCSDPPPAPPPGSVAKPHTALRDADWRGPWRLHCACSRLTDVCSELCTGELRVKNAQRLVPFARYSSDGLRAPPPSVPTSTSLGYRPGLGKEARSRNPKAIRGIEAKTRPKGSYSWHSDSTGHPRGVCLEPAPPARNTQQP